jgi:hypothetical protein
LEEEGEDLRRSKTRKESITKSKRQLTTYVKRDLSVISTISPVQHRYRVPSQVDFKGLPA